MASSDEDTDISESELSEYKDSSYELLKNGSQTVKTSDETYTCPYCPMKKRKRDYFYNEILQHASGVGESSSQKRKVKDRADHLALAKYLEEDLRNVDVTSKPVDVTSKPEDVTREEMFVWPWMGVIVNVPTTVQADGRRAGESGSNLRDEYIRRGFNPVKVKPLWNYRGHSGTALVVFDKNKKWPSLHNALAFERAYEADKHGKKDWFAESEQKSGLYAWLARADDYNEQGIIGANLQEMGNLKTISELMEEESTMQKQLVSNLVNTIQVKQVQSREMEVICREMREKINLVMEEKEKLIEDYNKKVKEMQTQARNHYQNIFNEHQKFKLELESEKRVLELRKIELEKREAHNESERKKLAEEIEANAMKNSSLGMAAVEQQKADENVLKLAKDHKKQNEQLDAETIELEKQLDMKQQLELEVERLKGSINVYKHIEDGEDAQVLNKLDNLMMELREKQESLDHLDELNQALIIREHNSNDELQQARKQLINSFETLNISNGDRIGVKRMGELDTSPFLEAMKERYDEEAEERYSELCLLWKEYLKDSNWHPLKVIMIDGKETHVIKDDDEKLNGLKNDLGERAYNAVVAALKEINEYNASGHYITSELWNYEEGRRASLLEGVRYLLKYWKEQQEANKGRSRMM